MSTNALRNTILVGLFAVPFIPLVVSKSLLFPFITGKAFMFRLIVEIIFACWLGLILKAPEYRPKFSWISAALMLFLIIVGIADLFAENPVKAFWSNFERMEGYIALLHFGMYFIVLSSVVKTRELWDNLFATSVGASAIMAIYSFFQIAGKITINQGGVRVDGTFGNATYLGIYMVFHIFLAAYLCMRMRGQTTRVLLGAVAVANLAVLYFTATRGAILGFLGGALLTFIIMLLASTKGDKIRKVALISIVSITALVGVFLISRNNSYIRNNPVLGRFASLSLSELRTQGRYYVWPIAWKGFLERPLLGWGQEGFNFVFNEHYNPAMYNQEPWFDRTHNIILDWLVAAGLLGFLSYVSILLAFFAVLIKANGLSTREKAVFAGLFAAYCFHNLFVFDQIGSYILFFTLLAFIHIYSVTQTPEWVKRIAQKFYVFTKESMVPITASLIVIGLASVLYFWQWQPWQENKAIMTVLKASASGQVAPVAAYKAPLAYGGLGFPEAVEHVSNAVTRVFQNSQVESEVKNELFIAMDAGFKKQLEDIPNDARYHLFYGIFLASSGNVDAALVEYSRASELSPQKQAIHFEIGSLLLSQGKSAEALAAFKTAYELEPSYEEARFVYGLAALSAGNPALSNELLSGFSPDKLMFDDRYISVLASIGRFNEIIQVIQQRIQRDPTNLQYRLTLAAAYLQSNQRQMAINTIQEMIVIDPTFKERGEYYITEIRAGRNP